MWCCLWLLELPPACGTPLPGAWDSPYTKGSQQDRCPRGTPAGTLQGLLPASLLLPEVLPGIAGAGPQPCLVLPSAASLHRCLHTSQKGCGPTAALHEPSRDSRMVTRERHNGPEHHLQNQTPSASPVACRPASLLPRLHRQRPCQQPVSDGWAEKDHFNSTPPLLLLPGQAWFYTGGTENGI